MIRLVARQSNGAIYLLLAGLFFTFTPCMGQADVSVVREQDSFYRPVSPALSVGFSGCQYSDSIYRRVMEEGVLTLGCYFSYIRNSAEIDSLLGDNARELGRLDAFVRSAVSDPSLYIKRISLTGYSSIEGTYAVNERLARDRVRMFKNHLDEAYRLSEQVPVDVAWVPEDWGGLYNMVQDTLFTGREDVLRLIETVDVFRGREDALMRIQGGKVYKWLLSDYFPRLRRVEIRVEYDLQRMLQEMYHKEFDQQAFETALEVERARLREEIRYEVVESLPRIDTVVSYPDGLFEILGRGEIYSITHTENTPLFYLRRSKWALKTNLLQWTGVQPDFKYTAPVANLALEYYVNDHWSVELGAMYSYWPYRSHQEFQGVSGYRVEPRYRLELPAGRFGVYLGLYGRVGDYDCQTTSKGNVQPDTGYTGNYWDAGVSTGLTVGLTDRLGLEFGVRGGYVRAGVAGYIPGEFRYDEFKRKYRRIRITDLNVSIIYCIR
jgi:hypothetical protein